MMEYHIVLQHVLITLRFPSNTSLVALLIPFSVHLFFFAAMIYLYNINFIIQLGIKISNLTLKISNSSTVTCMLVTNTFHAHKLKPDCLVLAHKTFTTNLAMNFPLTMVEEYFHAHVLLLNIRGTCYCREYLLIIIINIHKLRTL